jgi:hypothetical protein
MSDCHLQPRQTAGGLRPRRWDFAFAGGLGSPRTARQLVSETLGEQLDSGALHDVQADGSQLRARHAGAFHGGKTRGRPHACDCAAKRRGGLSRV